MGRTQASFVQILLNIWFGVLRSVYTMLLQRWAIDMILNLTLLMIFKENL